MSPTSKSVSTAHSTPVSAALPSSDAATNATVTSDITETTESSAITPASKMRTAFPLALVVAAVLPIAFGVGTVRLKASASSANVVSEIVHSAANCELSEPDTGLTDRRLGDRQFIERRYEVAIQYYRSLGSPDPARLPPELLYRIALCQEGLGLWSQALVSLRMVSENAEGSILRSAASFGQARIWFRLNEPRKAEILLRSLEFRSEGRNPIPRNMSTEIAFLIPLALAQESISQGDQIGHAGIVPFGDLLTWSFETALGWADEPASNEHSEVNFAEPNAAFSESAIVCRVKKPTRDSVNSRSIDGWSVDLSSNKQPFDTIVKRLADECGWTLDLSDLSADRRFERTVNVYVEDRPVWLLLTALCSEWNLSWSLEGDRLTIVRVDESGKRLRRMMARALASLTIWNPNYRLADLARFAQGQLAQYEGDVSNAASLFSSLVGRDSSLLAVHSAYNAATNYFRLGDFRRACTQLRHVVDGAPEQSIHAEATILLGRLLMDLGEIQDAVYQFRRATESRGQPHEQARAAVFLGMAFLMQNKFQEAAEAVFAQKPFLEEPGVRNAAAFVTAFARWHAVSGEMQEREATFLYRALVSMKMDSEWIGQTGQLLIGRAFTELGFDDHMADLYSHMLTLGVTDFIESEMTYSLASYEYENGRIESAKALWEKLNVSVSNGWTNRARLRLAELALTEGRAKDSLEFCEMIPAGDGISRSEIQKLMGRAFEQLGDDGLAARCFAGEMPIQETIAP